MDETYDLARGPHNPEPRTPNTASIASREDIHKAKARERGRLQDQNRKAAKRAYVRKLNELLELRAFGGKSCEAIAGNGNQCELMFGHEWVDGEPLHTCEGFRNDFPKQVGWLTEDA